MPLTHVDDELGDTLAPTLEELHRAEARRTAVATPEQARVLSAIDKAEAELQKAVKSGKQDRISAAMSRLEECRIDALREETRRRDLEKAQIAARKEQAAEAQAKAKRHGDKLEAKIRSEAPVFALTAPDGRTVCIRLAGTYMEPGVATEAIKRVMYQVTKAYANKIIGSRQIGKEQPLEDWLSSILLGSGTGLQPAIEQGVCWIEDAPTHEEK